MRPWIIPLTFTVRPVNLLPWRSLSKALAIRSMNFWIVLPRLPHHTYGGLSLCPLVPMLLCRQPRRPHESRSAIPQSRGFQSFPLHSRSPCHGSLAVDCTIPPPHTQKALQNSAPLLGLAGYSKPTNCSLLVKSRHFKGF